MLARDWRAALPEVASKEDSGVTSAADVDEPIITSDATTTQTSVSESTLPGTSDESSSPPPTSTSESSDNNTPTSTGSSSDDDPKPTSSSSSSSNPPSTSSSSSGNPPSSSSSSNNPPPSSSSSSNNPDTTSSSSSNDPPASSSSSGGTPPASSSLDPTSSVDTTTSSQGTQPAATETSASEEPAVPSPTSSTDAPPSDTDPAEGEPTSTTTEPPLGGPVTTSETSSITETTSDTNSGSESLSSSQTGSDVLDSTTSLSSPSETVPVGSVTTSLDSTASGVSSGGATPEAIQAGVTSFVTTIDGQVTTIMLTSWITTINGQITTITQTAPIGVHAAPRGSNTMSGGAIIGGAVGGAAGLLLVGLIAFIVWRRSRRRIANSHRRLVGAPATMSQRPRGFDLAGGSGAAATGRNANDPFAHEGDDDSLLFPHAGSPTSAVMNLGPGAGPLLRPRGSTSGSIFHETGIWPPPNAGSRLRDPLLSASDVELGGIVEGVMGPVPPSTSGGDARSRLRGGAGTPADPFSDYASPIATTPFAATFARGHNRMSSGSSFSGVTAPLLAAAGASASAPHLPGDTNVRSETPVSAMSMPMPIALAHARAAGSGTPGSARSRLALVTPATAGPSANPFSDAKAVAASSQFRSSRFSTAGSNDGHSSMSETVGMQNGPGGNLTLSGRLPPPEPPVATLVDLTPGQEAELTMPAELPPQYHTIRRESDERRAAAEAAER